MTIPAIEAGDAPDEKYPWVVRVLIVAGITIATWGLLMLPLYWLLP